MTKIGEYSGAIFLYGTIAGYLVLGVGILVKAICTGTGLDSIARFIKGSVREAGDAQAFASKDGPVIFDDILSGSKRM